MIRKIVIALLCLPLVGSAQTQTRAGLATQFNQWRSYPQSGPYSNTNLIAGANVVSVNPCNYAAGGSQSIPVFVASTPIRVVDTGTPSLSEVVTPTSIVNGGCTATLTTSNAHTSPYYFTSGTFGLQEAINATVATGVLNTVLLDSAWFNAGGTTSTIYGAAGSSYIAIAASNILPNPTYRWNGTHYIGTYSLLGLTAPTIAAGAAAGTAPTVANTTQSNGNIMTADVTTGTATTTGTLFTETVATAPPSGNMNCTVQSLGANVPPAFTVSITGGVLTVAVAVAPVVSTAYVFGVACE